MTRSRLTLTAVAAWLVVLGTGCNRPSGKVAFTQVKQDFAVDPTLSRLVLKNRVGRIRVVAGSADRIVVRGEVMMERDRVADTPKGTFEDWVRAEQSGNTFTVIDAGLGKPQEDYWHVSLSLEVPAGIDIEVDNAVGRITIETMESALKLTSGVGDIEVRSESLKRIKAHSGTGDLRIEVDRLAGDVALGTGVGDVTVTARSIDEGVEARTGTGEVEFTVTEAAPTRDIRLDTGVGDIRVHIPAGAAGTFKLTVGVGDLNVQGLGKSEMTGLSQSRGRMEFTLGQNGPRYEIHTGTGDVVLY